MPQLDEGDEVSQLRQLKAPFLAAHGDRRSPDAEVAHDRASEAHFDEYGDLPNGSYEEAEPAVRMDIIDCGACGESLSALDTSVESEIREANGNLVTQRRNSSSCHQQSQQLYSFLGEQPRLDPMPSIDPFRNHTEHIEGLYEWLKIVICLPLAIVRLILAILFTLIGLTLTKLTMLGWKQRQTPMPRWRRNLMYSTRLCARFILFCFGYHWIHRIGRPVRRELAPIVVSNHVSFTDPILYFYELFPSIVSSKSHDSIPGIGTVIRAMQVIYVDRLSPDSRKDAVREIKRKALCNDFPPVMLFPEGTTTNGRSLIFFQLGAFAPGLPVQPVTLHYPYVHSDSSWGRISVMKLLFRMLTQFHNFVQIEYLPVVYPSQMEKNKPLHFARKVRHVMAKTLNVVETDHSYGDLMLSVKASELKLSPASSYMAEMATMEKLFHLSTKEAKDFLEKFATMDSSSGYVTEDMFLDALDLPKAALSKQIFGFFDKEETGSIRFREFLAGSAFIVKHHYFGKLCKAAFESCDFYKQGFLTHTEVEERLRLVFTDIPDLQVQRMQNKMDIDGDGSVGWDDFRNFLEKYPELLAVFLPTLYHEETNVLL